MDPRADEAAEGVEAGRVASPGTGLEGTAIFLSFRLALPQAVRRADLGADASSARECAVRCRADVEAGAGRERRRGGERGRGAAPGAAGRGGLRLLPPHGRLRLRGTLPLQPPPRSRRHRGERARPPSASRETLHLFPIRRADLTLRANGPAVRRGFLHAIEVVAVWPP
jgi:hypothetical protein